MATLYERRASSAAADELAKAMPPTPSPMLRLDGMPSPALTPPAIAALANSSPVAGPSPAGSTASDAARNSPISSSVPPRILMTRNESSNSSFSRQSSVRSTASVQAVPMRTPARSPIHSPALSRHGSHAGYSPYVPELNTMGYLGASAPPLPNPVPVHIEPQPPTDVHPERLDTPALLPSPLSGESSLPTPHATKPPLRHLMPDLTRTSSSQSVSQMAQRRARSDFDNFQLLGQGSYSRVFAVTDKAPPHRKYALKVLEKRHILRERKEKYVTIEKNTLNRLGRHPGIVRIYWTFHDEGHLYFVLELAEKGEILFYMRKFGSFATDCARYYAAQIVSAVEHMHKSGVIHRDLKPENILLDATMRIKITDFGTAKLLDLTDEKPDEEQRGNSFVGTAEYVSPEVLTSKAAYKSSDLWALGVVLYQMLSGHHPFKGASEYLTFQKILKLDYAFPPEFPTDARNLIESLLVIDPQARPSLDRVKAHNFFSEIDWSTIWTIEPPTMHTGITPPRPPPQMGDARWRQFEGLDYLTDDDETSHLDGSPRPTSNGGVAEGSSADSLNGQAGAPSPRLRSRLAGAAAADARMSVNASSDKWSAILRPGEMIVFSSTIIDRSRSVGGVRLPRKRMLMLTDHGRLLSIKEHRKDVKVKSAVVLGRDDGESECLSMVEEDGPQGRVFKVVTSVRAYRYEDPAGSAARWIHEIRTAHDAGLGKQSTAPFPPG